MTTKTSVSLTDSQEAFARQLVESGSYASFSAVLQHGLEMLRAEREKHEAELAALRAFFEERRRGKSISMVESRKRMEKMIASKRPGARKA
jgi:antitoxin ParD1/3/4